MSNGAESYWAVIELMGHVRMAGRVTEVERFGSKMGRIDIPDGDGFKTQFFSGASIYRETPCSEEVARAVAFHAMPTPIHSWELPRPALPPSSGSEETCPGASTCHGALKWCSSCGDVSSMCDSPRCDTHRERDDGEDRPF